MSSPVESIPRVSLPQAEQLAQDLFGLHGKAAGLPSERDANFRLTTPSGERYVLKIANPAEGEAVLDFQNQAMIHLSGLSAGPGDQSPAVPRVAPSVNGELITSLELDDGQSHFVRMLTWLDGQPLSQVSPHDAGLMTDLGDLLGRMDRKLASFDHPAVHRDFHWDLARAGTVISDLAGFIGNADDRRLVLDALDLYRQEVAPVLTNLPCQVIHNDANENNVLIRHLDRFGLTVGGLIDYGDMVYSQRVNEAAIGCAYAMLGKADPVSAVAPLAAGYHRANPLTEAEVDLLFLLAKIRICVSVCHAAHQHSLAPDNDYLLISQSQAWAVLHALGDIHPNLARAAFRHACGLTPSARAQRVRTWLNDPGTEFASVMDHRPDFSDTLVLDLGIDSPLTPPNQSSERFTRDLNAYLEERNADKGIGQWNEPRLVYTAPEFAVTTNELPETRTIHIGLDIFAPAGSRVYAPLDGVVHSLAINEAPLDYGPTLILEHQTGDGDVFHTLYGHLDPESIAGLRVGQRIAAGQPLVRLGSMDHNGGWPPHLHLQVITDLLDRTGEFPGVARPSHREVWTALCPDPGPILGAPSRLWPKPRRAAGELYTARRVSLGRNLSLSYDRPLKIVRGQGQYLISDEGLIYLDGVNNVCHVGHCHPRVVAAGRNQMGVLNTNTRYLHDNIVDYAERLLATFPEPLNVVYFVCTGSEANELALRLARNHTNRRDLLALDGAYHGNTQGCIDISPYKHAGPGGRGAPPWVHILPMPDGYRGPYEGDSEAAAIRYADHVGQTAARLVEQGQGPAAMICESMLGCGGQVVMPDRYMHHAAEQLHRYGGVFIADEVQVGFGRAGSHFWAFESQDVIPDIVTLGKPIGNGHPLAAVVTTAEIAEAFDNGMEYFNTFGGNPVSCAVGQAVLDVIEDEDLQANAARMGDRLLKGLLELKNRHGLIGDARGLGLYLGAELVRDHQTLEPAAEEAAHICNRMAAQGILMSTDGPLHNVLKLKPPICINAADVDRLLETLDKVLTETRLTRWMI